MPHSRKREEGREKEKDRNLSFFGSWSQGNARTLFIGRFTKSKLTPSPEEGDGLDRSSQCIPFVFPSIKLFFFNPIRGKKGVIVTRQCKDIIITFLIWAIHKE